MAAIAASPSSSALAKTSAVSTESWQRDLKTLFDHAKERFPDVVWELTSDYDTGAQEDVWGHKAIVYARAPPSFLAQYFDVRPNGTSRIFNASPLPGENPTQSTFSLSLQDSRYPPTLSGDDHSASPTPSGPSSLLRLTTDVLPALFSNQLEYLYTGAGIGDAFEFLFDSHEEDQSSMGDIEAHRVDKLRKDLVFMWRSRLYSDVRIELTGPFAPNGDVATAVFSSHRFILASRSSYFRSLFLSSSFAPLASASAAQPITISLPSPPFNPASLHFTLGYIYSGTLFFSNRTFDLDTSFQIYRAAIYLVLDTLQAEVEARIVEEMMHGLYHAYLTLDEYNTVTDGRWGVGGCHCRTCIRRVPRVLEFAMADDVKNPVLERGARRALVGIFGEGWCTPEFAALPAKVKNSALRGVNARTTTRNVFPLLFAAEQALVKLAGLNAGDRAWGESVHELVVQARNKIDEVLCANLEEAFDQEEWLSILERDGAAFTDADHVRWITESIRRGLNDSNTPMVYQILVNSVLLRSQTNAMTGVASTLLSSTSPVRAQVEHTRLEILKWLRKRWLNVRQTNAFEPLDDWALKEISDELDVPVDDLLAPVPVQHSPAKRLTTTRTDSSSTIRTARDVESTAPASLRASVLNRNAAATRGVVAAEANGDEHRSSAAPQEPLASSRNSLAPSVSSVRTTARSIAPSVASTRSQARLVPRQSAGSASVTSPRKSNVASTSNDVETRSSTTAASRPKSTAPSVASVRSTAASVKSTASNSTLRRTHLAPPGASVGSPTSPRSPLSDNSTSYKSAQSVTSPRVRTTSSLSNVSSTSFNSSVGVGPGLNVPITERQRRISTTSVASATSAKSAASPRARVGAKSPAATRPIGPKVTKPLNGTGRPISAHSTRSVNRPTAKAPPSPAVPKSIAAAKQKAKAPAVAEPVAVQDVPPTPTDTDAASTADVSPPADVPAKPPTAAAAAHIGHASQPSDSSIATVRMVPILNRTASSDTITKSAAGSGSTSTPRASRLFTPRSSFISSDSNEVAPPPVEKDRPTSPLKKVALATADLNVSQSLDLPSPKPSRSSLKSKASKQSKTASSLHPTATSLANLPPNIRGITLQIGIPCMISSKRSRFKAFARYIGEVAGEDGPWIGVEVPVSEGWSADRLDGRDWNDGTHGGVRYFEIGSNAANSVANSMVLEEDEERAARRRRVDAVLSASLNSVHGSINGGPNGNGSIRGGADAISLSSFASSNRRKREGDSLLVEQERLKRLRSASPAVSDASSLESRGLFVRPTQVLLVMDAPEHR